jgi:hypothetical protein
MILTVLVILMILTTGDTDDTDSTGDTGDNASCGGNEFSLKKLDVLCDTVLMGH